MRGALGAARARRPAAAPLALLLLLACCVARARAGLFKPSGSRPTSSSGWRPSAASSGWRPPAASSGYRPPGYPQPAYRPPTAAAGAAAAARPGGFGGAMGGRPGWRASSLVLPFAAGALAGTAAGSLLHSNNKAYCDGRRVACYRAACEQALRERCPGAAAAAAPPGNATQPQLVLERCPSSEPRFSECWRAGTTDGTAAAAFECLGVRRPSYKGNDIKAICHAREPDAYGYGYAQKSAAAPTAQRHLALVGVPVLLSGLLLVLL